MGEKMFSKKEKPKETTLKEKVEKARKDQAAMTDAGREAERGGYMEELKIGVAKLTPEEQEAHRKSEERAKKLRERTN
ncbi:MAG: hypothetical protein HYT12_01305 [Candidatus Liptonbacteria bacterium]|nr:hypothetical protein [Candidatus Liptonbacteria bacterium]